MTAGRDGTIWLEESHSLIKVDETASFHRCSREMILIYVDKHTTGNEAEAAYIMIIVECTKGGIAPCPATIIVGREFVEKNRRKRSWASNVKGVDG